MNAAHLHLLVNHLPILGAFLSLPVLAVALWRNQDRSVLGVAAMLLVLAAGGAGASMNTGDGAEESVEHLPGVSEQLIHEHEEKAELATGLSVATALMAVGVFAWAMKRGDGAAPRGAIAALLLANLGTSGAMAATGAAGGEIRHTEIRDAAAQGGAAAAGGEANEGGEEEEEEEEEGENE